MGIHCDAKDTMNINKTTTKTRLSDSRSMILKVMLPFNVVKMHGQRKS